MRPRIWCWTTSWWNNAPDAARMGDGLFGLQAWYERVTFYLRPTHCYVACGTWSNPALSPLPVPIINAGVPQGTPYDIYYNHLSLCAMTAAMAYALNRRDEWDLLVLLDTDALIGAVDFEALIAEFLRRDEILLGQWWNDTIGGPLDIWKPEGAVRFLHCRLRANLIKPPSASNADKPLTCEAEMARIYRGAWWNPFPEHRTLRQDHGQSCPFTDNAAVLKWPFVRLPDPAIIEQYTREQTALARPVSP